MGFFVSLDFWICGFSFVFSCVCGSKNPKFKNPKKQKTKFGYTTFAALLELQWISTQGSKVWIFGFLDFNHVNTMDNRIRQTRLETRRRVYKLGGLGVRRVAATSTTTTTTILRRRRRRRLLLLLARQTRFINQATGL